jgi:hypothetical protein
MKFNKLVKIVTEAKGTKPGERYFNSKRSDPTQTISIGGGKFVSPISSSPVGKTESPELRTPVDRWEFDPTQGKDIGSSISSKVYSTMLTSFGLLLNDEDFKKRFNKISEVFGSRMQSYGHTKKVAVGLEGELETVKYDYEKKLDNLEFMKAKRAAQVTELNSRKQYYSDRIRDWEKFNKSPLQKKRLRVMYVGLKATVEEIEKQNKKEKNKYFFEIKEIYDTIDDRRAQISKLQHSQLLTKSPQKIESIQKDIDSLTKDISKSTSKLNTRKYIKEIPEFKKYRKYLRKMDNIEEKYTNSQLDDITINREAKEILDLSSRLEEMEEKYQDVVNELEENYTYIDQINELNEKSNDSAVNDFIHLVTTTAQRLVNENTQSSQHDLKSLQQLNWDRLPQSNTQKLEKLQALASDDDNMNPIIGYLNRFQRAYDNKEYISEHELNKNVNISAIRNFETLPFSIMMKIYKVVGSKKIDLKSKEYDDSKSQVFDYLKEYLDIFKSVNGDDVVDNFFNKVKDGDILDVLTQLSGLKIRDLWANKTHKDLLKELINNSGLPESFKLRHILFVAQPFVINRRGYNSFSQLLSSIDSDIRSTKPKTESFDRIFNHLLMERVWNDDDFKLDTMEILAFMQSYK